MANPAQHIFQKKRPITKKGLTFQIVKLKARKERRTLDIRETKMTRMVNTEKKRQLETMMPSIGLKPPTPLRTTVKPLVAKGMMSLMRDYDEDSDERSSSSMDEPSEHVEQFAVSELQCGGWEQTVGVYHKGTPGEITLKNLWVSREEKKKYQQFYKGMTREQRREPNLEDQQLDYYSA